MESFSKFIITGKDNNTPEENTVFLKDAAVLIRGRWGACATYNDHSVPYVCVTFTKYHIGLKRFQQGLGDLQWLLTIQRIPEGVQEDEALQYLLLQQKYNVQALQPSEPEEEPNGYHSKTQQYSTLKRKRT